MGDVRSPAPTAVQQARLVLASLLVAACVQPMPEDSLARRAVATLGARDGYVFVFSPFNCSLRGEQIDLMNELAARRRRTGVILTAVSSDISDSTAAAAVSGLGLRMRTLSLARSPLRAITSRDRLRLPLAIALRRGEVVGILSGDDAERVDTWIAWLEQRATPELP
jgi:hypothetical protein